MQIFGAARWLLFSCTIGAVLMLCGLVRAAEEPHGCDKFKWPVTHEQAALAVPNLPRVATGGARSVGPDAFIMALLPPADAHLPMPPERASKQSPTYAGYAAFAAPKDAGVYQVTLATGVWVDLVQNGAYLKPVAFSGALDCANVRKLVRFQIGAAPFTLQVSGAADATLGVIVELVADAAK